MTENPDREELARIHEATLLAFYNFHLARRAATVRKINEARAGERFELLEDWWLEERVLHKRNLSPGFDRRIFRELENWEDYPNQRDGLLYLALQSMVRGQGFSPTDIAPKPHRGERTLPDAKALQRLRNEQYPQLIIDLAPTRDQRKRTMSTLLSQAPTGRPYLPADWEKFMDDITRKPRIPKGWVTRQTQLRFLYPEFLRDAVAFQDAARRIQRQISKQDGVDATRCALLKKEFDRPIGDTWAWAHANMDEMPEPKGGDLEGFARAMARLPGWSLTASLHNALNHIVTTRWLNHYPSIERRRHIVSEPSRLRITTVDIKEAKRLAESIASTPQSGRTLIEAATMALHEYASDFHDETILNQATKVYQTFLEDPTLTERERAIFTGNLASHWRFKEQWKKAITYWRKSAEHYDAAGEDAFRVDALAFLAEAQHCAGYPDVARRQMEEASDLVDTLPLSHRIGRHAEIAGRALAIGHQPIARKHLIAYLEARPDLPFEEWQQIEGALKRLGHL